MTTAAMEEKMVEVLNLTIETYERIYHDGNRDLANQIFDRFTAQLDLVTRVINDRIVSFEEVGDGARVVLK